MPVVWNEAALKVLLQSPAGAVGQDLARRAIQVETRAKQNASGRPGPNVQTGNLRSSITWAFGAGGGGLYAEVGTNVHYAIYLEFGTSRMPAYPFLGPALAAAA